ncbi:necrosis inducing-like protein NPP1 type [Phytophthora sojae]|uniref:Necrosis inducing-like protein NPP1 type n=1 Tax=Phytophthora sojae (strain P6497) TaxID=1094619 RepID=G4ZHH3_PHYSP|nr:necrosis inducing-like protein NPP1 type [Phytophthora sojae]EGZ18053.1 necrosis inducing-like protein NPP1 type [Phytophthora sojae]|eukprot:XP_009527111.1 necrosis inducing-like protein NPP1 type [Phytophthora sojae]
MNFRAVLIAVVASFAAAQAGNVIPYDEVHPFAQPAPVTDLHKTMLKYKPHLKIKEGCHPYPAVQKNGDISGGLEWSSPTDNAECKGSPLGSQVYARSSWVKGKFAIMYAWYFPMGRAPLLPFGHRNGWEYAIVWLDSVSSTNSTILGTSLSAAVGWAKEVPRNRKYLDGNNLKVAYYFNRDVRCTAVEYTEEIGEFQDVITWDQLPAPTRDSLSNTDWDHTPFNVALLKMPMKDGVFQEKLNSAYPF